MTAPTLASCVLATTSEPRKQQGASRPRDHLYHRKIPRRLSEPVLGGNLGDWERRFRAAGGDLSNSIDVVKRSRALGPKPPAEARLVVKLGGMERCCMPRLYMYKTEIGGSA